MATLAIYNGQALDDEGNVVSGAKVEVRKDVSGTPLASIFSDRGGDTALANPFNVVDQNADDDGKFFFHVAGGPYRIRVYTGSSASPTFEDIRRYEAIGTSAETDFGTAFLPRGAWSDVTTYAQGDLVSYNDGVGDNYAFVSNDDSNLDNEPSFDGSNVGESDANWTVVGLIEAPGTPGADGSSDIDATSTTSNSIGTGSKSFTIVESDRGWSASGARLRFTSSATPLTNYMEGVVTSYDGASAVVVTIDTVPTASLSGPFTDWVINLAGDRGITGNDPGVFYDWDDGTTDADPGSGNMRADNADLSAATELYVSKTDKNGNDVETFLGRIDDSTNTTVKGVLLVRRASDDAVFTVDYGTVTDDTDYIKLAIVASSHSGATALTDGDVVSFQPTRNGDKGTDGDGAGDIVGPGSATAGNAMLWGNASATTATDAGAPPILRNLVTTRGDIIYRNDTVPARLAIGTEKQILAAGANDPEYSDVEDILSPLTASNAAAFSDPDITLNVEDGKTNYFTRTMAGNETLQPPSNMPVGWSIYFDVTPGAHTLSFDADFVSPTPSVGTTQTLIAIVKRAANTFVAAIVHEAD